MAMLSWLALVCIPIGMIGAVADYRKGVLPGGWCLAIVLSLVAMGLTNVLSLIKTYGA